MRYCQLGKEISFQEAAVANLVRAFITVKTHQRLSKIKLISKKLEERKDGMTRGSY